MTGVKNDFSEYTMKEKRRLNRRSFLGVSAGLACSTMLPACLRSTAQASESISGKLPAVSGYKPQVGSAWIKKGEQAESQDLIKQTLESASDFSWLAKGDKVLVKLALNSGNVFPATSDPWMLRGTINFLKEKGAGEVLVGDQSGVRDVFWTKTQKEGSSRKLCGSAGLLQIINETGAIPVFFEESGYDSYFETSASGPHHWKSSIWLPNVLKQVDHIVYLPRVSSHVMGDLTAAFKLAVGFLREDSRRDFHSGGEDFYAMYEEINEAPEIKSKLRLTVTSGRLVQSTFGPDSGNVSEPDYGLIFASEDLLVNELLAYAWLQWNREFETSLFNKATMGNVTNFRSFINRKMVEGKWEGRPVEEVPDIAMFEPGDIYDHPSILNFMQRKGGRPETLVWNQLNTNPNVSDYLKQLLKI